MARIAFIRSTYSPYGGVEVFTRDLLTKLLSKGNDITLYTRAGQNWPLAHPSLTVKEITVCRGPRLWELWRFDSAVQRKLRVAEFDLVFSLDLVKYFTHLHAGGGSHKTFLQTDNLQKTFIQRLVRKISPFHNYYIFLEKQGFINPYLKRIHSCSKLVTENLTRIYPKIKNKIVTVPNSIDWSRIDEFYRQKDKAAERLSLKFNLAEGKTNLLFVGSGFERKGLDFAIKGLACLPKDYHLIVAGKGYTSAFLRLAKKTNVQNRINFLGPVEDAWQLAACCCAFLLPSRYEPFGLAAAEAQAMGLPVLVSGMTGYAEHVKHGENGLIVRDINDPDSVKNSFKELHHKLSEHSFLKADEIRNKTKKFDHEKIFTLLIKDFLEK